MTLGGPSPTNAHSELRMSRRVSSMTLSFSDDVTDAGDASRKRARPVNPLLSRQVSHDGLVSISDGESELKAAAEGGRTSPVRCVSEFDKVAAAAANGGRDAHCENVPPFPNPLHDPKMLDRHMQALRLEADLHPMRLILSRLMAHPTLNRKGIFNVPVDPVALRLPDYFSIIKKPMDLGTVKVRLHAIAYQSRREVAEDIRLVFGNAMKYNPPHNTVHLAAKQLLAFFEEQVQAFVPELAIEEPSVAAPVEMAVDPPMAAAGDARSELGARPEASMAETVSTKPTDPLALPSHPAVHTLGTRNSTPAEMLVTTNVMAKKRKKRGSRVNIAHACDRCEGRTCSLCQQGCLALEATLLICNGAHCAGARIRKGAVYFISSDGGRQYCQRCHTSLPAVLPASSHEDVVRYKRDLLKRKNDEEIVERWLTCTQCDGAVHQVCAMHNEFVNSEDEYRCPSCVAGTLEKRVPSADSSSSPLGGADEMYSFVSGSEQPVKLSELLSATSRSPFCGERLPETDVSAFMQRKVRECIKLSGVANAERTVSVRVISDCQRYFKVPDVVRNHFRMAAHNNEDDVGTVSPPTMVNYRSKAIALFQKVDGMDVCIFCMYVQEYDGMDEFEQSGDQRLADQKKRVYIAYLDSVEHFRPRPNRTSVYHEMLVSYLATARKRGFENAHIWACPPSRGNSFVFWNHPASQRTPSRERLVAWYHDALSRAIESGVVTDVKSLYESDFEQQLRPVDGGQDLQMESESGHIVCPPLLDGDFWIEEAARIHSVYMSRHMKVSPSEADAAGTAAAASDGQVERCPARQVASLLREKIMAHPSSYAFRKPVNAAAMKLADYHKIIADPMDLGTVYSRCMLGEYRTLRDLVADVELTFANACRYNPKGHLVHERAIEMRDMFFAELNQLVQSWKEGAAEASWSSFADLSMSLDNALGSEESPSAQSVVDTEASAQQPMETSDMSGEAIRVETPTPDLLSGGADAVQQRMVGDDTWILDKSGAPPKGCALGKKTCGRRRKSTVACEDEPDPKRRRQSWLGVEVGVAVRRMRNFFFTCSLVPNSDMSAEEEEKERQFQSFAKDFCSTHGRSARTSKVADARHALLEFSQFRNLEFDTLRRAKYSTAILLYHLHSDCAQGLVPTCTSCHQEIKEVRWHKVSKVVEHRRGGRASRAPVKPFQPEELCCDCHAKLRPSEPFIPLQVSLTSG